ncbi:MAG: NADH-quinone oxidoreductase subunit N, partial [Planctomycetaceae bacterium]
MNDAVERIAGAVGDILPEVVLLATVCAHFLAGPFLVSASGEAPAGLRHRWGVLALLALLVAAGVWLAHPPATADAPPLGPF